VVPVSSDRETCPIPREQLLDLLDTMTPVERQRTTAELAVVVDLPPDEISSSPFSIRFRERRARGSRAPVRIAVISASFATTLVLGLALLR
jgi:hypothetical protein